MTIENIPQEHSGIEILAKESVAKLLGMGKWVVANTVNANQEILDITRTTFGLGPTYRELTYKVNHESLTHTLSRDGLFSAMEEFEQMNDCQDFTAVFVDLKGFKGFNDQFTHAMGDNALKAAAWGMKQLFHLPEKWKDPSATKSLVARLGGDEFIGLLPYGDNLGQMLGDSVVYETLKEETDSADSCISNLAQWNVAEFLDKVNPSDVPKEIWLSLNIIAAVNVPIIFRYDIGLLSLQESKAEDAVVTFLEKHGSKYVRESDSEDL